MTLISVLLLVLVHAVPSIAVGVPVELAGVPVELAGVPVELAGVPVELAGVPVELAGVPVEFAGLPVELAGVPVALLELAGVPVAIVLVPVDLALVPVDLALAPVDLALVPVDFRWPADLAARAPAMAALFMAYSASTSPTSPCMVEICQPVVAAVPGFEPRWDFRGRRTDLFLAMLVRMDLGAPSSVAKWVALTGVTVDYRMPERTQALQFNVFMRWRIGAFGAPLAWTE